MATPPTLSSPADAELGASSQAPSPMVRVAVCVITFRRPGGLRRVLESLADQRFRQFEHVEVFVVVVDNDATATGRDTWAEVSGRLELMSSYHVEASRGIPFARNRALEVALDRSDFIAFIDDDEVAEPQWLDQLLVTQRDTQADVVTGPVLPVFVVSPPRWAIVARVYDRPRLESGSIVRQARTGNALLRTALVRANGSRFNESMALTGGSDNLFFLELRDAGAKIVWSDEARVSEWVPPSRVSVRWALMRAYRIGSTDCLCDLIRDPSIRSRARRLSMGLGRLAGGLAAAAVTVPGRDWYGRVLRSLRKAMRGAGVVAAVLGARYDEYRRVHTV